MRYTSVILILLALLLISSCVTGQGSLVGRINGEPIKRDRFMVENRSLYEAFSFKHNRSPNIEEGNEIKSQTWANIIKDVILKQHFAKYKIQPSLSEAIDTLKASPPAYILKSPVFQTNGVFDPALYQQSLLYGQPEDLTPIIRQYRDYYVPVAKLKKALIDDKLLTAKERKTVSTALSSMMDIDLVLIDATQLEVAVREDEINLYYDMHRPDFAVTPHYDLAYGFLPLAASGEDKSYVHAVADTLFGQLTEGADAEALVASMKDKVKLISWQDMGFFKIQELEPSLATAFASMASGSYMEPRIEGAGIAIHQLNQKTKTMLSYSTLFIPYLPRDQTIAADKNRALQCAKLLRGISYSDVAQELDIDFLTIRDLGLEQRWLDASFDTPEAKAGNKLKKGFVPEPVFYAPESAWLLIQITDSHLEEVRPLAEVRQAISAELVKEKRRQFAFNDAKDWLKSNAVANTNLSGLKSAISVRLTNQQLEKTEHPELSPAILFDAIIRHLKNQPPVPYQKDDLVLIPLIRNLKTVKKLKADPAKLRGYFVQSLPTNWFEIWMDEQMKKAKVVFYGE